MFNMGLRGFRLIDINPKSLALPIPRLKNWTSLVHYAVKAEVPDYEIMTTMANFLSNLTTSAIGDNIIKRLSKFFGFPPDA